MPFNPTAFARAIAPSAPSVPTTLKIKLGERDTDGKDYSFSEEVTVPVLYSEGGLSIISRAEFPVHDNDFSITQNISGLSVFAAATESAAREVLAMLLATGIDWGTDFETTPVTDAQKELLAPAEARSEKSYSAYPNAVKELKTQPLEYAADGFGADLIEQWAVGVTGLDSKSAKVLAVLRTFSSDDPCRSAGGLHCSALGMGVKAIDKCLGSLNKSGLAGYEKDGALGTGFFATDRVTIEDLTIYWEHGKYTFLANPSGVCTALNTAKHLKDVWVTTDARGYSAIARHTYSAPAAKKISARRLKKLTTPKPKNLPKLGQIAFNKKWANNELAISATIRPDDGLWQVEVQGYAPMHGTDLGLLDICVAGLVAAWETEKAQTKK